MAPESEEPLSPLWALVDRLSFWACVVGSAVAVWWIVTLHPLRALWAAAFLLLGAAGVRVVMPGRPWFAVRGQWVDVLVLVASPMASSLYLR